MHHLHAPHRRTYPRSHIFGIHELIFNYPTLLLFKPRIR